MITSTSRLSSLAIIRRLSHEWRPYWPHILGILFLSLLSVPLALLAPVAMKIAVDSFIGSEPLPEGLLAWLPESIATSPYVALIVAVVLALAVALLTQLLSLAATMLRTYTNEHLVLGFRTRLFPHVQRLSLSYHDEKGTSDSTYRILYDTAAIPSILVDGVIPFITALITLVAMFYVVIRLSWQLALVALAIAPVLGLISLPYNRRLRDQWHILKELESAALALLQEVLSAVRVVKTFGKEEREKERLVQIASEGVQATLRVTFVKGQYDFLIGMVTAVGMAVVLTIGMLQVKSGALTLGDLLLIVSYLYALYGPLQVVVGQAASLQSSFSSADRALALLDEVPEVIERPNARRLGRAEGAVAFRDVSFAYDEDSPVLHDLSFEIGAGTRLGIAGETGAGKTTLVNLLTRLYDPTGGAILLDGVDLRDYKVADLRDQFAIVLQEPVLFSKTIAENIAYARPGADQRDLEQAARLANAHDFISRMPDGYATQVGERGMRLSGGERQRISLARAFLKDAPILILDEPTSSVDVRTETSIMDAMERLMRDRTTFIIAHRLSTLSGCDEVLVIEGGRLVRITSADSEDIMRALDASESGGGGDADAGAEVGPE